MSNVDWKQANTEILRIAPNGDIILHGRRTVPEDPSDDRAIVDALRIWALEMSGAPVRMMSTDGDKGDG